MKVFYSLLFLNHFMLFSKEFEFIYTSLMLNLPCRYFGNNTFGIFSLSNLKETPSFVRNRLQEHQVFSPKQKVK